MIAVIYARGFWLAVYLAATIVFVAAIGGLVKYGGHSPSEAIYFVTGVVLLAYTIETYRLRRQAQLQAELQTRPFLSIASEGRESGIYIVNLGQGLARNISIDTIRIGDGFELSSRLLTHIAPGDPAVPHWRVKSRVFVGGEMADHPGEDHAVVAEGILTNAAFDYLVVLTYSSIIGQRYRTSLTARKGAVEIEIIDDRPLTGQLATPIAAAPARAA